MHRSARFCAAAESHGASCLAIQLRGVCNMTAEQQRKFCEALGIRREQVQVERVPHPTKRAHMIFRVSHPRFGEGSDPYEARAWKKFMDAAEKAGPLPTRCQAIKKDGQPCGNAPQHGESFCGPHLSQGNRPNPEPLGDAGTLCAGVTASGQPCRSRPQKGERFCGPHLTKAQQGTR